MKKIYATICFCSFICLIFAQQEPGLMNQHIDGYRGIWFELNQKYPHGDKYSGALGTYTAKHIPLAVYAPAVDKTFFVYGGTTAENQRHLLCMVGSYDHKTGTVSKPIVAYDKLGVNDPHDNPTIMIDAAGYIWVFVSGRGNTRPGIKIKSQEPYSIEKFEIIAQEEFTYPQIWKTSKGYFHFFTKYTGVRELYFETSPDALHWSEDRKLAGIVEKPGEKSGHYQVSGIFQDSIMGTFFNRHRNGDPDTRTDLYYIETRDFGKTWYSVNGQRSTLPLTTVATQERVQDYLSQGKNVYVKDLGFDAKGRPVCLYLTSNGHEPGPENEPYEWRISAWDGKKWRTTIITTSDHNYDMGSLFISGKEWKVVAPTGNGPQLYGVGGELEIWTSSNAGKKWKREKRLTTNSQFNHAYVRRPLHAKAPFCFFWASGHPHEMSKSNLYFGDFEGNIWRLPYHMTADQASPEQVAPAHGAGKEK